MSAGGGADVVVVVTGAMTAAIDLGGRKLHGHAKRAANNLLIPPYQ